ncbi:MAG: dienelactone hydrolase family protein, partial [Gammaproteobacteria bacterium]|nr:dienelactone hydrolase family protein [Gammaproteobacteria bacterium]
MKISRHIFAGLSVIVLLLLFGCQASSIKLPSGISPVQATWLYGKYSIPATYVGSGKTFHFQQGVGEPLWTTLAAANLKTGAKVPVVLYLHGCKGMSRQADRFNDLLVSAGYAVFMPDSFKRPGRRQCGEQGTLRERVALRIEEVEYAFARIKEMAWVDQNRVMLMGFSEGGNATDNWSSTGFAGLLVMGSACTLVGGKPAAPVGTPVLAVVGADDEYRPGKSCSIDESDGVSKSIVIQGAGHAVAQYPET